MNFITTLLTLTLLSTKIHSTCVVPTGYAYWYTLPSDTSPVFPLTPDKPSTGPISFCAPARKCYGGQRARIYRLDFDGNNQRCVIFHEADCKGVAKKEVLKSSGVLAGTESMWYEWRSFFCYDVRLGIVGG